MIGTLLEGVGPHVTAADAVFKSDETVTVELGLAGGDRLERRTGSGCHLRVLSEGRVGMAGTTAGQWRELQRGALENAVRGPTMDLIVPAPSPMPEVHTADRVALTAGPGQVLDLARSIMDRLEMKDRAITAWAERSCGRVEVGNTRGVTVNYEASLVGLGVRLSVVGPVAQPVLTCEWVGTAWPTGLEIEQLVAHVGRRLAPATLERPPRIGPVSLWLGPRAVRALLRPLELAVVSPNLFEGRSPLRGREGEEILPRGVTIVDDPTVPFRPGSRPVDDDGVVSRRLPLVEEGRFTGWIADLATGARLGVPSTGHSRRHVHAPPRVAFSNLIVAPGDVSQADFLAESEGILVEDLPRPAGNVLDGQVAFMTPWAYWMSEGERVGRFEALAFGGNLYDMLTRLTAVSRESEWHGAWCGPSYLLDGMDVRVR